MRGCPPDGAVCLEEATTLSILSIIFAVSVADFITCFFTLSGSTTSDFYTSPITPFTTTLVHLSPAFCFARS